MVSSSVVTFSEPCQTSKMKDSEYTTGSVCQVPKKSDGYHRDFDIACLS